MIPLRTQGGFKTNAAGGGLDNRIITTGHWAAVYASCQCNGNGQWVAGPQGDADFFQQGANVVLGPFILRPGEHAEVAVVGASANAQASIVYHGWQSDESDGSDLAQVSTTPLTAGSLSGSAALSLTGNVPVINATGTQLQVFNDQVPCAGMNPWTFSINTGPSATKSFTLPDVGSGVGVGVHALAIVLGQNASQYANANLFGNTSETNVTNAFGLSDSQQIIVPILSSVDTSFSLTIGFTALAGQSMTVYVVAILDAMSVQVQTAEPLNMVPFDQLAGTEIFWDRVGPSGPSSMGVSLNQSQPAPWLAPNLPPIRINQAVTAGNANRIVVKTGVANKLIYLHSAVLTSDQALAGGIVLWDGDANAGGTARDIFSEVGIGTTGEIAPNNLHLYRGAPLGTTTGNMLSLTVDANATVRGYVALSQA